MERVADEAITADMQQALFEQNTDKDSNLPALKEAGKRKILDIPVSSPDEDDILLSTFIKKPKLSAKSSVHPTGRTIKYDDISDDSDEESSGKVQTGPNDLDANDVGQNDLHPNRLDAKLKKRSVRGSI